MSRYDYEQSLAIACEGRSFYALIMAAMRQADTSNLEALKRAFPGQFEELWRRYNAPGGYLPSDVPEGEDTIRADVQQAIGGDSDG